MQLVEIEDSVLHAAEVAISKQIVLLVRIERAGHDRAQNRLTVPFGQKLGDLLASALAEQSHNCVVVRNEVGSHELMDLVLLLLGRKCVAVGVAFQEGFGNVAERTVTEIVKEPGKAHETSLVVVESEPFGHQPSYLSDA